MDYIGLVERVHDSVFWKADAESALAQILSEQDSLGWVLDFGGGCGRVSEILGEVLATGFLVADVEKAALSQVTRNSRMWPVVISPPGRLPIATASVDAVIVVLALHHIAGGYETLAELARIVRPGGSVHILEYDPAPMEDLRREPSHHHAFQDNIGKNHRIQDLFKGKIFRRHPGRQDCGVRHLQGLGYLAGRGEEYRALRGGRRRQGRRRFGACIPISRLAGLGFDALIVRRIGPGALARLLGRGTKVFIAQGKTVRENLELLKQGALLEYRSEDACKNGGQGHGHGRSGGSGCHDRG